MICVKARRRKKVRTQPLPVRCDGRAPHGRCEALAKSATAPVSFPPISAAARRRGSARHDEPPPAAGAELQGPKCDQVHIAYRDDRAGKIGSSRFHRCFNHWTTKNCTWLPFNDILTTEKRPTPLASFGITVFPSAAAPIPSGNSSDRRAGRSQMPDRSL